MKLEEMRKIAEARNDIGLGHLHFYIMAANNIDKLLNVIESAKFMIDNHAPQLDDYAILYWGSAWTKLRNSIKELEKE